MINYDLFEAVYRNTVDYTCYLNNVGSCEYLSFAAVEPITASIESVLMSY